MEYTVVQISICDDLAFMRRRIMVLNRKDKNLLDVKMVQRFLEEFFLVDSAQEERVRLL